MVEEYRIEQMPELINKIKAAIDSAEGVPVTKTATGNPIEITDGADGPLVKCVTQITGYQSGTGTPSPDNVRPIVAYTEGEIEVRGKNLFKTDGLTEANPSSTAFDNNTKRTFTPDSWCNGLAYNNYFISNVHDIIVTENKIECVPSAEAYGIAIPVTGLKVGETYTISAAKTNGIISVAFYRSDGTKNTNIYNASSFSVPANTYWTVFIFSGVTPNQLSRFTDIMLVSGSTATDYEPYTSTTHTTTYPSAIYRGSEDCVNGTATTEWGMIASYDGETLPGEWISDRDEYAPGTTPTTGAQVAYKLATPTTSSVTPTNLPIKSLSGYNHIESSTGALDIEYFTSKFQPIIDLVNDTAGDAGEEKYTTSEQAIGKWIDGRTVYQRTFDFSSDPLDAVPYTWMEAATLTDAIETIEASAISIDSGAIDACYPVIAAYSNGKLVFMQMRDGVESSFGWLTVKYVKPASA